MWVLLYKLASLGLDGYTNYKLSMAKTDVEREKIKADVEKNKYAMKVALLSRGGWWFQLFFIVPLSVWFSGVVIYSLLWCQTCAYPQPWDIAALPDPLNEWAGWIIGYLFLVKAGR